MREYLTAADPISFSIFSCKQISLPVNQALHVNMAPTTPINVSHKTPKIKTGPASSLPTHQSLNLPSHSNRSPTYLQRFSFSSLPPELILQIYAHLTPSARVFLSLTSTFLWSLHRQAYAPDERSLLLPSTLRARASNSKTLWAHLALLEEWLGPNYFYCYCVRGFMHVGKRARGEDWTAGDLEGYWC